MYKHGDSMYDVKEQGCLYFSSVFLARELGRMADKRFAKTGLCPSAAFLLLYVIEEPGLNPTAVAEALELAPSTITRFADTLVKEGYITRDRSGKNSSMLPTEAGTAMKETIQVCWNGLYEDYASKLGKESADRLACEMFSAFKKLT